jgi:LytTr DNA-binding domain
MWGDGGAGALAWIRASIGTQIRLIAVEEVRYFQANDKYTSVFTAEGESPIRTSLRDLAEQLDPDRFGQIHRGTIVNVAHVAATARDLSGPAQVAAGGLGGQSRVCASVPSDVAQPVAGVDRHRPCVATCQSLADNSLPRLLRPCIPTSIPRPERIAMARRIRPRTRIRIRTRREQPTGGLRVR